MAVRFIIVNQTTNTSTSSPPQANSNGSRKLSPWQKQLHDVIFEAETPTGKLFDLALFVLIILSVIAVMLETVESIDTKYHTQLYIAEWVFTVLFTIEYALRLICVRKPWRYALSFYGIVDLLAILPLYISLLLPGSQSIAVVRALRLLRIFRVLKLARFVAEANLLKRVIWQSREKLIVFLSAMFIVVVLMGTLMYLVEQSGDHPDIHSIPEGVYWSIVTITTVGYGDFVPHTFWGKVIAAVMMVLGYSLIIVPVGIFTAEIIRADRKQSTESCPSCNAEGHRLGAKYCYRCGDPLNDDPTLGENPG